MPQTATQALSLVVDPAPLVITTTTTAPAPPAAPTNPRITSET